MNTVEPGVLLQAADHTSPNRYVMVSRVDVTARRTTLAECFVYIRESSTSNVLVALGRTTHIALERLQDPKIYAPLPRPFVIRRDDGHEITYA